MAKRHRVLVTVLVLLLVVGGGLTILLTQNNWNWARPIASWAAARVTGRHLAIRGNLRVDLGKTTEIEAHDVHFSNARWAHSPEMFAAHDVALTVRLFPLLHGRILLDKLDLGGAGLELERNVKGENNWSFGANRVGGQPLRIPAEASIRWSDLTLLEPQRPQGYALHVADFELHHQGPVLAGRGHGVYQGQPLEIRARLERDPRSAEPVPFTAHAATGQTVADAKGVFGGPQRSVDADLRLRGPSLQAIWQLAGLPLPHSPPFSLAAHCLWRGHQVELTQIAGRLGSSDFAGSMRLAMPPEGRMSIGADLRSRAVDFDDIEGFYGRPPSKEPQHPRKAAAPGSPTSIFPDQPFSFPKLQVADAKIRYVADEVKGGSMIHGVALAAVLDHGKLDVQRLHLAMAGGALEANGVLDATHDVTGLAASIVLSRIDIGSLVDALGMRGQARGIFGGRAELESHGNSLREIAENVDGRMGAALQSGWLSGRLLELVALHLGGYLQDVVEAPEKKPINCVVGVFDASDGVMKSQALLLDTDEVRIDGGGTIDLADESIDLELRQHAKKFELGALQTPIEIKGPLQTRKARLEKRPLLARGGAVLALGALVSPLAALIPLVDLGRGDKPGACASALLKYQQIAEQVPARHGEPVRH
jgi:uncharacterized protein involved in outer membrane biogenesis